MFVAVRRFLVNRKNRRGVGKLQNYAARSRNISAYFRGRGKKKER
jgi:hypothetical protein